MAITHPQAAETASSTIGISPDAARWLWFGLGSVLWLFSVGGRWDLSAAAWLFPVFLLRFSRSSRPALAIGLVWAVSCAAAISWMWQLAVPLVGSSIGGALAYGTLFALPFVLDRLFAPRLGVVGSALLLPAAIVAAEFIAGTASPLGAAYGLLAVTQHANLPLLQVISVAGPYAIGFLVGWFGTVANLVWAKPPLSSKARIMGAVFAAVMVAVIGGGGLRLAFFPPPQTYVRIAGIAPSMEVLEAANKALGKDMLGGTHPVSPVDQAAIDPAKLAPAYDLVVKELLEDTRAAAHGGAKVVVWSENAAVLRGQDEPALLAQASALAREEHIYIDVASNVPFVSDRTHLIDPTGAVLWRYDKAHPIPGMEVYKPGSAVVPVVLTPWGRLANVICYDADFPGMMRAPADVMLIPGGDWPQMGMVHTLKMASLRAIENGYSMVRQDYDGLSAATDYQGHVLASQDTTIGGRHIMFADVPTQGVDTVYRRTGDLFAWLCLAVMAGLITLGIRNRQRTPGEGD
jgi:apolipoprotein N-acyltransferase